MDQTIREIEKKDGVRLTWNILPINKVDYTKQSIPIACLYSLHKETNLLEYEPVFCQNKGCRAIINPYAQVNFQRQDWVCCFCQQRSLLPNHYKDLEVNNLAAELMEENTTIEYLSGREISQSNVFFIILDGCFFDEERRNLALNAVLKIFNNLPDDSYVGLVTFGTNIELFDLSESVIRKTYLFSGVKTYKKEGLLNFTKGNVFNKFIVKKGENYECFTNLIKEIRNDPFPVMNGYRPLRCTGSAISFVSSLLGNLQDVPVKYFIFTQGPCTFGPGTVASVSLSEGIRSYMDIIKGRGAFYTQSVDFYTNLAKEISFLGHSVDILSATLYDVGIYEMKPLVDLTGGIILLAQDFNYEIYLSSCEKITKKRENYLNFTFNNKVKVITSPNLKFKGCLGIGMENQGDWKINCLYEGSNLTLLFDNNNETRSEEIGYIQIITQKQRSDKKIITRVTTLARMFSENKENVLSGFDQEAAMVLQARIFTSKKEPEEEIDLVRRIDRILVKFLRSYASYQQDTPSSLTLPSSMSLFPKFMYFFRRSLLVLLEGISPDEGAYQRNLLLRESTVNSITMIIPTLISYHYQGETGPVEMDATSLNPEVILLFDSFHCVVIWRGNYIAQWLKENLHLQEEYKFLQDLVENVENTGKKLVSERLLTPKFVICDQFGSQERLLLARVNPSVKGKIVTDDIDYETFKGFLYKLAVSS